MRGRAHGRLGLCSTSGGLTLPPPGTIPISCQDMTRAGTRRAVQLPVKSDSRPTRPEHFLLTPCATGEYPVLEARLAAPHAASGPCHPPTLKLFGTVCETLLAALQLTALHFTTTFFSGTQALSLLRGPPGGGAKLENVLGADRCSSICRIAAPDIQQFFSKSLRGCGAWWRISGTAASLLFPALVRELLYTLAPGNWGSQRAAVPLVCSGTRC